MTTFLTALQAETNLTFTENGAVTNRSSLDPVVDFFALAGAMRDTPERAADLFEKAFNADPQTAARTLFYLRDVRGGQGERDVFRACLRRWGGFPPNPNIADGGAVLFRDNVLRLIPEYGRWDDLFAVGVTDAVVDIVRDQLKVDLLNHAASDREPVSLLAKWLPSENTSSPNTRRLARELRTKLRYTPAEYRRILSKLRRRIHLLEQDMSANRWSQIDYGKLPSQAHRKHVKAFWRHDGDRYASYLASVQRGEAKINVSTVYPYEIYDMVYGIHEADYANVAWENLPDYTNGRNALVMADVSGSMMGRPMSVSVSLALYFAERNQGAFNGYFMTFSAEPQLVQVTGRTLQERMGSIERSRWGMNTNLSAAFSAILNAAKTASEPPPEVLYVISDMEFDAAVPGRRSAQDTVFRTAKREFAEAGYELPHVVFWNVNARNMQVPATILDGDVTLVSGCSPMVFGMAVENKTPREVVDSVVNSERYQRIVLF